MAADPNDPFQGNGVKVNGQWVPKDHPLAQQQTVQAPGLVDANAIPMSAQAPGLVPSGGIQGPGGASTGGGAMTPQQAQQSGLSWVPADHPLYGTPGFVGSGAAAGGAAPGAPGSTYTPPNAAPGTPGAAPIDTQNQNAQTYSPTPGAAPGASTTNQGTQDVVRNTYLQTLQKGTAVDTNDPNFRQQSDAYAAAQERARRNMVDDAGQAMFAEGSRGSGAQALAERMAGETATRNVGQFEGELVGRELQNRRSEIQGALDSLGGMIDSDQRNALQRELASLDAALKRESLAQTGSLGERDLSLRDKLGTGALNVDLMRALLQNQQFGSSLGFDIGSKEADYYLRSLGL